LTKTIPITV